MAPIKFPWSKGDDQGGGIDRTAPLHVTEGAAHLVQGRCGFCGGPLTQERLLDPQLHNGENLKVDRGEHPYCAACRTFWPETAQKAHQEEAARHTAVTQVRW